MNNQEQEQVEVKDIYDELRERCQSGATEPFSIKLSAKIVDAVFAGQDLDPQGRNEEGDEIVDRSDAEELALFFAVMLYLDPERGVNNQAGAWESTAIITFVPQEDGGVLVTGSGGEKK